MTMTRRIPALVLLFLALLSLFVLALLGSPPDATADPIRCTCREGNACYHYLNAPVDPPDDPCNCPQCRVAPGTCPKKLPKGWDPICASNDRMECFLRRHAASWHLSCSERLAGTCECKNAHPEFCPMCGNHGHEWDAEGLAEIRRQVQIERRILGNPRGFVIVRSPHFYVVTDIRSLKIRTQSGSPRIMRTHEIAHVYAQRAEIAWHDFVNAMGSEPRLPKPCGIYLVDDRRTQAEIQDKYFGNKGMELVYGGGYETISGGYCYNGLTESLDSATEDYEMHLKVRHCIGHILMSCWPKVASTPPRLPWWLYAASGHWLARMHPRLAERATFCSGEGSAISNSGKRWDQKVRKIAQSSDVPIQRIFDASWEDLDLDAHIRTWSWFDVFLAEDRENFVKFLLAIRDGENPRNAVKAGFGCAPEEMDQRWRDRVLGKRPSVAMTPEEVDAAHPDEPGAKERAGIRMETDPATLASRIRALGTVRDPLTAATIVPRLAVDSANVRETIVLVLSKSRDPGVLKWLRTEGLAGTRGIVRAYVARVLGNTGDEAAGEELAKYADDGTWLVRAHVARALGLVGYEPATEILKGMLRDSSPKVRIMVMDALGRFGEKAASAWDPVSDELGSGDWQTRSAAVECLANLGEIQAVDPLIDRMEIESGRVREDIHQALKKLTRDDLGENPKYWREWWEKEKERRAAGQAPKPAPEPADPGDHEYGQRPTYYGLEVFSQGVGYVLDVSSSMLSHIQIDPKWLERNGRKYASNARKFDLARNEIAASLGTLDPRVKFNLYFFRSDAFTFKSGLVPATSSNVDSAVSRMAAEVPTPQTASTNPRAKVAGSRHQTNYVDAFRLVLDVKQGQEISGRFTESPDTIYFLTDGRPTTGDITDTDTLLSWFREMNRFARMRVNVISFGQHGVDAEFLDRLAKENGGTFILVPEVD